jgi:hypothetical protein
LTPRFRNIPDGAANIVMLVEATDEDAVRPARLPPESWEMVISHAGVHRWPPTGRLGQARHDAENSQLDSVRRRNL